MAVRRNLCWPIGSEIIVRFLDGPNPMNARVQEIASEWMTYANIKFNFIKDSDKRAVQSSDVRVTFRTEAEAKQKKTDNGHWSLLGTYRGSKKNPVPLTEPTMNIDRGSLQTDWRANLPRGKYGYGTVLHEFGHAIGLEHEHLRPDRTIQFNELAAYDYYLREDDWDADEVKAQVTKTVSGMVGSLQFDPYSVMMYGFPAEILAATDPELLKKKTTPA